MPYRIETHTARGPVSRHTPSHASGGFDASFDDASFDDASFDDVSEPDHDTQPGSSPIRHANAWSPAYRSIVHGEPDASTARDGCPAPTADHGLIGRLRSAGHAFIERLRTMFAGIANVKDRLFHGHAEVRLGPVEQLAFQELRATARNNLLAGIPLLEARLQARPGALDHIGFQQEFRQVLRGLEGLALLAKEAARSGTLPAPTASRIGALASTDRIANDETAWQLADRMLGGDFAFLGAPGVRRQLVEFVGNAGTVALEYARATGDRRLAQLALAGLTTVEEPVAASTEGFPAGPPDRFGGALPGPGWQTPIMAADYEPVLVDPQDSDDARSAFAEWILGAQGWYGDVPLGPYLPAELPVPAPVDPAVPRRSGRPTAL